MSRAPSVKPLVRSSIIEGVGRVVLSDVEENNVLTRRLVDEAIAAHDALAGEGVRVAVLAAEGSAWCGGGDFKAKREPGVPPAALELFSTLNGSPMVWIAAVHAPVLGAGMHLASACLRVLMADDAWMSVPGWSEGRFPGPLTAELARIIGHRRAVRLAMTEERIEAVECLRLGLADAVVPARDLQGSAQRLGRDLLAADESALAAARQAWSRRLETPPGQGPHP
ncbi:enoyl-CoA hydratase/isomerase family protein [Spirillospora sp. NPDC029432]|uniref:enoyl-CoA hydratase/isomerase family protein n=1 Tax=Spirillospora sp. NPDC029432 TaxID=3154599 RepID=UPI0034535C50